ncbi:MAG: NAD-dependent epimerase/dehydratase family protein, partial [Ignavibacteriaceae bacterium]|nr:NAD-dependent epimerase/dehydratase family protein [Ignavibacteriaceae bacterium]
MKILVTGGSGFLGINLIRYLYSKGNQIKSLDLVDFDYPDIKDKIEIIKGDIRDKATVERTVEGVDIIVHSAA